MIGVRRRFAKVAVSRCVGSALQSLSMFVYQDRRLYEFKFLIIPLFSLRFTSSVSLCNYERIPAPYGFERGRDGGSEYPGIFCIYPYTVERNTSGPEN